MADVRENLAVDDVIDLKSGTFLRHRIQAHGRSGIRDCQH
jgi:hypothetical protein